MAIHSGAGCWALAWPTLENVRIKRDGNCQGGATPDVAGPAGERQQHDAERRARTPIRTSSTDAVCEPTTLPHTDGLIASDGVPATTFAPYRPNDPSEPTNRKTHASHSSIRLDAESADCIGQQAATDHHDQADQRQQARRRIEPTDGRVGRGVAADLVDQRADIDARWLDADLEAEHAVDDVAIGRRNPPHHDVHTVADRRDRRLHDRVVGDALAAHPSRSSFAFWS